MIVASLNDYWKKLKLDVLFADVKANEIAKNDDNNDEQAEIEINEKETVAGDGAKGIAYKMQAPDFFFPNANVHLGMINRMLMAFSVKNTGRMLFTFDEDNDGDIIYCIYGLKGLATIFLFISLKFLTIGHVPFTNRAHLTEVCNVIKIFLW